MPKVAREAGRLALSMIMATVRVRERENREEKKPPLSIDTRYAKDSMCHKTHTYTTMTIYPKYRA